MKRVTAEKEIDVINISKCSNTKIYVFLDRDNWVYKICHCDNGYIDCMLRGTGGRYFGGYTETLQEKITLVMQSGFTVYELKDIEELITFLEEHRERK